MPRSRYLARAPTNLEPARHQSRCRVPFLPLLPQMLPSPPPTPPFLPRQPALARFTLRAPHQPREPPPGYSPPIIATSFALRASRAAVTVMPHEGEEGRPRESPPPTLPPSPPPSKLALDLPPTKPEGEIRGRAPFHTRRQHSLRPLPCLNRLLLEGWTEVSPPTHPHSPQIHRFTTVLFISEVLLDILHFLNHSLRLFMFLPSVHSFNP
jgi:hypothetical protein